MRIRRKKDLDERMKKVSDVVAVAERDIINVKVALENKKYFNINELFGNDAAVEMDIGCGKGAFICELAKANPDKNFIAVEMIENIIIVGAERAHREELKNLKFVNTGAEYLPRYFKDGTISKIYLNFSPPYPQSSYKNRRLTNDRFISVYKKLLRNGGIVEQKTDDKNFFEYSIERFLKNGFKVTDLTDEYTKEKVNVNTCSEFENKFRTQNVSIYFLRAFI